jgi:hypothetical protein
MSEDHYTIIKDFGKTFNLPVEMDEPEHWLIGSFELYSPQQTDIAGTNEPTWDVYAVKLIPGVRTMPNGDPGYPDEYDAFLISSHVKLWAALEVIGHLSVTQWIDEGQMAEGQLQDLADEEASMLMHAKLHDEHPEDYEPS